MAFPSRATLRPVFATATAAILFAGFASAAAAQDTGGYRGPLLSWTGKSPPPNPAPVPAPAPAAAASDDARATYVAPRHVAPAVEAAPERASPPPVVARAAPAVYRPPPTPPAPEAAPPPDVAESEPPPAPYVAPPKPAPASRRAPLAAVAPAHAAVPATAPVQSADAAPLGGSPKTHVRFYSLHRAYGMTPDPIAMPAKRPMVLVGPADGAAGQSQNGADDDASDGGKAAPHDDGKGAGGPGDPPSGDN